MPDSNIKPLYKETLLKAIENSIGSRIFNSLIVKFQDTGAVKDILNDGEFSCAFFVSSLLYLFGTVPRTCTTVKSLREMASDKKWRRISPEEAEAGDVVFWEKIEFEDGTENPHVGFALGNDEAVSTNYIKKIIDKHPLSREDRKVEAIYRYSWDQ
ncbi:MAG: hypothetical protein KGJ13_02675 [Patescibacteria group bacterium]|nr:hypothetical protein [Patescibacteria group bacterium]